MACYDSQANEATVSLVHISWFDILDCQPRNRISDKAKNRLIFANPTKTWDGKDGADVRFKRSFYLS